MKLRLIYRTSGVLPYAGDSSTNKYLEIIIKQPVSSEIQVA